MNMASLLTWSCVVAGSVCISAYAERGLASAKTPEHPGIAGAPPRSAMAEHGARSAALPVEAQYTVSAAMGRDQAAYHVVPAAP